MGILQIEPLPKHQIMVLTYKAIKVKMRGQLGGMEKSYPHRPYADGGTKGRKSMRELLTHPRIYSCKHDAKKKPPLTSPVEANGVYEL